MQLGNYLFSYSKVSGTIARETGSLHVHVFVWGPFVQLISQEISQATFLTHNSRLKIIKDRVLSLKAGRSRDCQLTFEQYCMYMYSGEKIRPVGRILGFHQSCDQN